MWHFLPIRGFLCACYAMAFFVTAVPVSAIAQSPSPDEVRQFMTSRDRQLNNMMLQYKKSGAEFVDTSNLDFLDDPSSWPSEIPFSHQEKIIIRNHEFTFFSDVDPDFDGELESGHRLTPHIRWTNRGGHVQELGMGQDNANAILTHLPEAHSFGGGNTMAWPVELSLGVGYGKRMQSLVLQDRNGDSIVAKCVLSLSDKEKSDCELIIDSEYIVRSATIRSGNDQRWYLYKIDTEGLLKVGDFQCAEKGNFAVSVYTREADGSIIEKPLRRYTVSDVSIMADLSNTQYEALTSFEIPEKVQVDDPHGILPRPGSETGKSVTLIVLVNIILIAVLSFFALKRRLSTHATKADQ
jgi:hypothetical protein